MIWIDHRKQKSIPFGYAFKGHQQVINLLASQFPHDLPVIINTLELQLFMRI